MNKERSQAMAQGNKLEEWPSLENSKVLAAGEGFIV